ncbi:topoisomerase II [Brachybacterium sp. EF45031]|uniref:DUF5926 family protein n=1 Tax=Brachybacterium sillae TaxID=2810536 RepID=UPI00217DB5D8|nr:DUF5926 family protein [Brachybacterium sillae]MCS6712040.1 topoisomerase II [Brachybacterium sillae]
MSTSRSALVRRPFEGLPAERDLVAMRQLIPAATLPTRTSAEHGSVPVTIATILPMAWPAIRRTDGSVILGLQASVPGGDLSRAFGQALHQALDSEDGTPVTSVRLTDASPRLQDLLDVTDDPQIEVHDTFDFWIDEAAERTPEVERSLAQANDSIMPTRPVPGLPHAYWVDAGPKEHLRWVLDAEEDRVIDAVARLHARRESGLGEGTKYVGSFRAEGLTVPVWDLPKGFGAGGVAAVAEEFRARFEEALASTEPLTPAERRARGGIVARQVTLR